MLSPCQALSPSGSGHRSFLPSGGQWADVGAGRSPSCEMWRDTRVRCRPRNTRRIRITLRTGETSLTRDFFLSVFILDFMISFQFNPQLGCGGRHPVLLASVVSAGRSLQWTSLLLAEGSGPLDFWYKLILKPYFCLAVVKRKVT